MSEKSKPSMSPEEQERIINRTMDMGRHPWFTENIAAPLSALIFKWTDRHPNIWINPDQLDKLPKEGSYLASINHSDNDDSIVAKLIMKGRAPMVPGKISLYKNPIIARLYRAMGSVPIVRREDGGRATTQRADEALSENLDDGEPVFVYDEGTRMPQLKEFGPKSSILAAKHHCDLYPIAFAGTQTKGSAIAVHVGDPIPYLSEYEDMPERKVRKLMHAQLQPAMEEAFVGAYELLARQSGDAFDDIFPGFGYNHEEVA